MKEARRAFGPMGLSTYLFAAAVGVIGGLVGTTYQVSGRALQHRIIGPGSLLEAAKRLAWYEALLIPFFGAIVAALLAHGLTRRRASQGMADVMEAVTLKKARELRVSATVSRALSSFALIVTGGSLGREGPIAYMAASFGARFARLMRVPLPRLGLYAGCGIAAGMSASYFAPFGAALFALEIVLGNFAIEIFGPVVVSSITSSLVVETLADGPLQGFMSGAPLYTFERFAEGHPAAILFYLALGILAALGGWLFLRATHWAEVLFRKIPVSPLLRLPLGGLLVGLIGIWLPEVWGNGYEAVNHVLKGNPLLQTVAILFVMKIVATAITLGAGGSGGIFTPTLFVGVSLGMLMGTAVHQVFPIIAPDPRPYAVVGMAAAIAATTHAPITAIFMLFEMTQETAIVLPLMVAAIAASLTSRAIGLESVYRAKLLRRGVFIPESIEETALTTTRVRDLMRPGGVWVRDTATFDMIVGMFQKTRRDAICVLDGAERVTGVVRLHDVKNFLTDQELGPAVIAADLTVGVPQVHPEQTLAEILHFFDDPEMHDLPVVEQSSRRLLAMLDRRDLLTSLSVEVLQSRSLRAKFVEPEGAQHYVEIPPGHALGRIPVPADMAGKTFASTNFRMRTGLTVLTVITPTSGRDVRIQPQADTVLGEKDFLIVIGPADAIRDLGGEV